MKTFSKSFSKTIESLLLSHKLTFSLSDSKAYSFHISVYRRDFDDENNFSGNYKGEIDAYKVNKSLYFSVQVLSTAVVTVNTEISKQILQIEHAQKKTPKGLLVNKRMAKKNFLHHL